MAGPKRRGPRPVPEPLGGIVVDGANVIASSRYRPIERLDLATSWCQHFFAGLDVQVFVDYATAMRCQPSAQATLRARCQDVTPGRPRYAVTPHHESADQHVLEYARDHHALILSNDRFHDFDELRRNTITLQFTIKADAFTPYREATWFRHPGTAERVEIDVLRDLRGSAGG